MGNVLVISDSINGFFSNSVCNELTKRMINIFKVGYDDERINGYLADSQLIFMLLSDEFDANSIFFASVKKKCRESSNKIVAYGSSDKISDIKKVFPENKLIETFVRPMDNAVVAIKLSMILEEIEESAGSSSVASVGEKEESEKADLQNEENETKELAEGNSVENEGSGNIKEAEEINEPEVINEPVSPENQKTILVVDDSGQMLRTILGWLEGKYKVKLANSAETAAVSINKDIPDLILLDYEMPEVSGPEFFKQLKENDKTKDIPVIFLTAQSNADLVKAVLALRPQGYILKTTSGTTVVEKVDEFFRKQNG